MHNRIAAVAGCLVALAGALIFQNPKGEAATAIFTCGVLWGILVSGRDSRREED